MSSADATSNRWRSSPAPSTVSTTGGAVFEPPGTGYSSLAYLKRFPVDMLKVDKSFVDGLGENLEDTAIVEAVTNLAHALGLRTVAEGIETTGQLDQLRALGCELGQGYYFSRPLPAHKASALPASFGLLE